MDTDPKRSKRRSKPRSTPGKRGAAPPVGRRKRAPSSTEGTVRLYGAHAVTAALANPARRHLVLHASGSALARLRERVGLPPQLRVSESDPTTLDRLVGRDAVHQGLVLECERLDRIDGTELFRLAQARLLIVLDQVTDPHNVGAILRSAVAMDADAVMVTARDAAPETGVLAKSASGALDMIDIVAPRNLSAALNELNEMGFAVIGLDSEGPADLAASWPEEDRPIALVLGAEGRGLRQKTRETCTTLARLDLPGRIRSLNVSNAAAISLYLARQRLSSTQDR